jgi:AhpD family alkylhydroperoxidase
MDKIQAFNDYRTKMNQKILDTDNLVLKRIFNLDSNAFLDGHLDGLTKELIGLTSSLVLRCDDCVRYHLQKCYEKQLNSDALYEALSIANLVGGTIVIPHLRRAVEFWNELNESNA